MSTRKKLIPKIYPEYNSKISWVWHRLLFAILPRHILAPLRMEIHLLLVRLKSFLTGRRHIYHGKDLLVNIGAGPYGQEGWINIDGWKHPGVNIIHDCRRSLPFPDGSVRGILCEHFLEHIDYTEDAPVFLSECLRVLKPGGVLRIIVPDAEKFLFAYMEKEWDAMSVLDQGYFNHLSTKMEIINEVFRGTGWHHKYAYDDETLNLLLKRSRFSNIQRKKYRESILPALTIDREFHEKESLYVEAVKEKEKKA